METSRFLLMEQECKGNVCFVYGRARGESPLKLMSLQIPKWGFLNYLLLEGGLGLHMPILKGYSDFAIRNYSQQCSGMPGIEPELGTCQVSFLPAVLSF